jgi:hypothetical protein
LWSGSLGGALCHRVLTRGAAHSGYHKLGKYRGRSSSPQCGKLFAPDGNPPPGLASRR